MRQFTGVSEPVQKPSPQVVEQSMLHDAGVSVPTQ